MEYNPFSLLNKTILVTGASSGIGQTAAIECSKAGAKLIITGRNNERLNETFNSLEGSGHQQIIADISITEEIDKIVSFVPALDGAVSCAGTAKFVMTPFINEKELTDTLRINTITPILLTQKLVKMKKFNRPASIVYISSVSGNEVSTIGLSMYGTSKSGLSAFMRHAALDLAPKEIRCNCVNLSRVFTKMIASGVMSDEEQIKKDLLDYPLKRYGKPEEIAYGIIYLLSDASAWVTGTSLLIDGGFSLKR
ncbi:MAG: SDR family oxidoreductase [Lentimicrobiaceae bacterium]|nr:SDR family oxidoreductase [Lentimicrobiaceae bacterium]